MICRRGLLYGALAVWFLGVATTFYWVWRYKLTPGQRAEAPATWPETSALLRAFDRPNIVMIAHPQCACTRASMTELARLADELDGSARIHVVIVKPSGTEAGFEDGAVIARAEAIPNVVIHVDDGAREAERFGAHVSGTTLVYSRDGALLFNGGITTARGHEGRGPAHERIAALVHGRNADRAGAPTFGCELADPELAP